MNISITLPKNLRSEAEIIASWKGDISNPLVSIRCTAFNHVNYIEDAIKGFLIQETDFPIEILIHDDASTDGTREIIEHYQAIYPRLIKSILQTENQYSKGNKPGRILMDKCLGKYCAVCEGDDFWVDPLKLQKQSVVLERNPTLNMVIHPALKINAINGNRNVIGRYRSDSGLVPLTDIITKKFGQIPTASTFVRRSVHDRIILFRDRNPYLTVGDVYLQIFGAENSGAFYINEVCSVYRQFVVGSWTSEQMGSPKKRVQHAIARIESFNALKFELPKYSHDALLAANSQWIMVLLKDRDVSVTEKLGYFRSYYSSLSFSMRLIALPLCLMPNYLSKVLVFVKRTIINIFV